MAWNAYKGDWKKLNENFLNKNKEEKLKLYFSYVLSTSELYNKILMDCFEIKLNQVLQFGLPRNDLLIKKILTKCQSNSYGCQHIQIM